MSGGGKSVISFALLAMTFQHSPIPNKGFFPDGISQPSLQASALPWPAWSKDHLLAFVLSCK